MNSHSIILSEAQIETLKMILEDRGYEEIEVPYARFAYKGPKIRIILYEKKNNLLIQGSGTEEFVTFTLEPQVTGILSLNESHFDNNPSFEPHFGIDESGKGDYFGPLVVAGVYTNKDTARKLKDAGVCDSKAVSTSQKIRSLAKIIKTTSGIVYDVLCISPKRYNELYNSLRNLNTFLAWGHAQVIENLLKKQPDCPRALSDQFARPTLLQSTLKRKNITIKLEQRTKAESDIAVAAASILAREKFIDWMDKASKSGGIPIPLGANQRVIKTAQDCIQKHGLDILPFLAKIHFKTTQEVLKKFNY